jgi:hypothetical protein
MEEKNNGGEFNLVLILKDKFNLTVEDAIKRAAKIHDDTVREFIALEQVAFKYDETLNDILKRYVEALKVLMRGNIEWSTKETARYPHIYTFEEEIR